MRKPIAAFEQRDADREGYHAVVVVCDDGAVFSCRYIGAPWESEMPVPGTELTTSMDRLIKERT